MVGAAASDPCAKLATAGASTPRKAAVSRSSSSSGRPLNAFAATVRTRPPVVSAELAIPPSSEVRRADSSAALGADGPSSEPSAASTTPSASGTLACSTRVLAVVLPAKRPDARTELAP